MPPASRFPTPLCKLSSWIVIPSSNLPLVGSARTRLGRHCWPSLRRQTWRRIPKYRNLECLATMFLYSIPYSTYIHMSCRRELLHVFKFVVCPDSRWITCWPQRVALSGLWNQGRFHGVTSWYLLKSHPLAWCPLKIIIKFQLVHFRLILLHIQQPISVRNQPTHLTVMDKNPAFMPSTRALAYIGPHRQLFTAQDGEIDMSHAQPQVDIVS